MLRISGCGTGYSKNVGFLSDYMRKISQPGVAICLSHKETLHYGSSDKKKIKFTAL